MIHLVKRAAKAKVRGHLWRAIIAWAPDIPANYAHLCMEQVCKSLRQSATRVADLVTTRQPARRGLSIPHRQPSAKAGARAKTKARAQEAPSWAKEHGEKEMGPFLRLMMLNGSGLRPAHRMHRGHRAREHRLL